MTAEKKKYNYMEPVFQAIQSNFISLPEEEIRRNNEILRGIIENITGKMKETDILFKTMFTRVFFGGSFYDGLRVKSPDEFDLDLLLQLPKATKPELITSNKPGFVHLKLTEYATFLNLKDLQDRYKGFSKFVNSGNFLDADAVRKWMEGVVTKTLNKYPKRGNESELDVRGVKYYAYISKAGPAFTLKVVKPIAIDIDLVPCFDFEKDMWPQNGFRENPITSKSSFFIVPKPLKEPKTEIYWRLSFQEQERVLMNNNKTLKPTIKLLKKMRDNLQHCSISSYFIKTVLLWELDKRKNDSSFWNSSLSYVFMVTLKEYYNDYIQQKKIPYYWNKKNNLIASGGDIQFQNIANKLKNIIDDIDRHPTDPYVVAKYILNSRELMALKEQNNVIGNISKLKI